MASLLKRESLKSGRSMAQVLCIVSRSPFLPGRFSEVESCSYQPSANLCQQGDKVDVTYLPENPEDRVILGASMEPGNLAPIHKYATGLIALVIGVSLIGFRQVLLSASQQ